MGMRRKAVMVVGARALLAVILTLPMPASAANCLIASFNMPVTMEGSRASVPIEVNGKTERFWLDTGAWFSFMSQAKSNELGLRPESAPEGLMMAGIGGSFTPQVARIKDFAVNGAMLHNVDFIVGGSDAGNAFLGRNILANADTEFDLAHGAVKLVKAQHCEKSVMSYWAPGKPYFIAKLSPDRDSRSIHSFTTPISLNGATVRADIDSGALTLISRAAAERAGIDLNGPGAKPTDGISGLGRKISRGWRVRFVSVAIGDETILNVPLTVIDGPIASGDNAPDMLLGIDYLLAHHVYVSRAQGRIYITYTGGAAFQKRPEDALIPRLANKTEIPVGSQVVAGVDHAAAPATASEFSRRGSAKLAQNDFSGAIADFGEAIRLEPTLTLAYRRRSEAYAKSNNAKAARADFDKAVALAPHDPELLRARAWVRHGEGDDAGALADLAVARQYTPEGSLDALAITSLYVELGQVQDALSTYNAVIANHKDDARLGQLLNGRCWSRALANVELDLALADCNRALKLNPKNGAILDSRALVEFRLKNFTDARADYDALLAHSDNQPWSHYMRGWTRIKLGEIGPGSAERDAAVASDPAIIVRVRHYLPEYLGKTPG